MNQKTVFIKRSVCDLVITKRHVADSNIKKVFAAGLFKAFDLNFCVGIKLLRNAAGDAVQLYAVELAALHRFRQTAEKVANAAGRLQYVAGLEAHFAQSVIHCLDNGRAGIVGVQGRAARRSIFLIRQKTFELLIFFLPTRIFNIKRLRQTTPADVFG